MLATYARFQACALARAAMDPQGAPAFLTIWESFLASHVAHKPFPIESSQKDSAGTSLLLFLQPDPPTHSQCATSATAVILVSLPSRAQPHPAPCL